MFNSADSMTKAGDFWEPCILLFFRSFKAFLSFLPSLSNHDASSRWLEFLERVVWDGIFFKGMIELFVYFSVVNTQMLRKQRQRKPELLQVLICGITLYISDIQLSIN